MKSVLWIAVLIGAIFEFIKSIKKYRNDNQRIDLVFIIGSAIMIPSGVILLISEIIDM